MKAFIVGSWGLSVKKGKRVQLLKSFFFQAQFFSPRVWVDIGLKDESRNKISAQKSI